MSQIITKTKITLDYTSICAICCLCPPVGLILPMFGLSKDFKNWKIYTLCIAFSLAVFAYCYVPTTESDLFRYFQYIDSLKGVSLLDALNQKSYSGDDNLWLFVVICWGISAVNQPGFLPFISVFIVYYVSIYMACCIGRTIREKNSAIWFIIFVCVCISFYSIVNNIRNILAFCIIFFAMFRDLYQKKFNLFTILLYILPCFLHASAILLVLIRVFIRVLRHFKITTAVIAVFIQPILSLLVNTIPESIINGSTIFSMIAKMVVKGNDYFTHTTSEWAIVASNSGSIKLAKIIYITIAIIFLIELLCISRKKYKPYKSVLLKNNIQFQKQYLIFDFSYVIIMLALACIPMVMPEYWRFASLAILTGSAIWIFGNSYYKNNTINVIFTILAMPCLILWMRDLFLYSDIASLVLLPWINNGIILIIKLIMGFFAV